jgi:ribosomal protein S18 acetylase RimI-like enzyme
VVGGGRPLLPVSPVDRMIMISTASIEDAEAILVLQRLAYRSEAELYDDWSIAPLTQTLEELREEFATSVVLKVTRDGRLVGSVRAEVKAGTCMIGRLIVHPDFQRQGVGSRLLAAIEDSFPHAAKFELFTGSRSEANIRLYRRHGYAITRTEQLSANVTLVFLEKPSGAAAVPVD